MFLLFQILTAVAFFGINFIPQLVHNASVEFHCHKGITDFRYCPNGTAYDVCVLNELLQDYPDNATNLLFNCDVSKYLYRMIAIAYTEFTSVYSLRARYRKSGCWI